MKSLKSILFPAFILFCSIAVAQKENYQEAESKYAEYAYIEASEIYKEVANKGFESEELLKKLANSYYFNADYKQSSHWYGRLFQLAEPTEALYSLRFAQSLKAIGETDKAEEHFQNYLQTTTGVTSENYYFNSNDDLIKENSGRYSIKNLNLNSTGIDFGAALFGEKLIFASTRDTGVVRRNISAWDGLSFLDLYIAPSKGGSFNSYKKLGGDVNTSLHESSVFITKDGKTMFFTGNRRNSNRESRNIPAKLRIFRASFMNGKWGAVEDLSINSNRYSNAHPTLNPEENTLYFSSDRPGGFGDTDIYKVKILPDGALGEPENLGGKVNTIGRETFPFVTSSNILYFSSDGHYGLGGLDIFYWNPHDKISGKPINVGDPVNSSADDFAFSYFPETKSGYLSSNRPGGKGYDDIYSFLEGEEIKQVHQATIFGKVTDKDTGIPLPNTRVSIIEESNDSIYSVHTDEKGEYSATVKRFEPFMVRAENEEYYTDEKQKDFKKFVQTINFELDRNIFKVYKGEDLRKALGIEDIYFDLDQFTIRKDAAVELEKVFAVMKKYPQIKIEIRSFTDSRASADYNLRLSERRAEATAAYLVDKGIESHRLSYKGLGEEELINNCAEGVECSEEEHQQNRRSEFILTEF